mmetsp:Transcript_40771/g.62703  ORF Transcript_40771/g.62703 Transcript_40771/m.62703 type:complete len:610 (-) Transcript_40771:101-1930(-)
MGSDAPQSNTDGQSGASSVPYNPLTHATHEPASGNNLVRDLMSVYESLTQSKTPQTPTEPGYNHQQQQQPSHHYSHPPQQHQQYQHGSAPPPQQQQFSMPPGGYHVPPPPPYPPTQQGSAPPTQQTPYYDPTYATQQQPYTMITAPENAQQHASYPPPAQAPAVPDQEEEDEGNDSEEADEAASGGRPGRRKRRGSDVSSSSGRGSAASGKGRKKAKKASDGRWSKRFTWPEDLHRDFVSAIFDVGLKHSSPSTIIEHMPKHEQITAERIKSHLQKYRMHRLKSKKEFITSYESSLRNFQARGLTGVKTISSGEVAAHLTYTAMGGAGAKSAAVQAKATASPSSVGENQPQAAGDASKDSSEPPKNDALMLPQLTDAEKQSPIGAAMGYLMGLFFSLKQQLMIQRALEAGSGDKAKNNAPVQAVFNSFVAGNSMASPAPAPSAPVVEQAPAAYPSGNPTQASPSFEQGKPAGTVLSAPSVRTNIEENSIMKQEMQNQMALQNKMRALKQQELNKYKNASPQQHGAGVSEEEKDKVSPQHTQHSAVPTKEAEAAAAAAAEAAGRTQGAGEQPGNDAPPVQRTRDLSIGASDEFWNTDVVDEQLFEFLMNS